MLDVLGPDASFYRRHAALSGAVCVLERFVAHGDAEALDEDGVRTYRSTGRSFESDAAAL